MTYLVSHYVFVNRCGIILHFGIDLHPLIRVSAAWETCYPTGLPIWILVHHYIIGRIVGTEDKGKIKSDIEFIKIIHGSRQGGSLFSGKPCPLLRWSQLLSHHLARKLIIWQKKSSTTLQQIKNFKTDFSFFFYLSTTQIPFYSTSDSTPAALSHPFFEMQNTRI